MRRIRNLVLLPSLAALVAVSLPAAAMAKATAAHQAPASCGGTVFHGIKLQNIAADNYMAESVSSDDLVLYHNSGQYWDGFRDHSGHLIIYRCGTHDVLTDKPDAKCLKGYAGCAYVTPYKDSSDQWWSRIITGSSWALETIHSTSNNYVLNDPQSTKVQGTHVVMDPYAVGRTNEEFRVVG